MSDEQKKPNKKGCLLILLPLFIIGFIIQTVQQCDPSSKGNKLTIDGTSASLRYEAKVEYSDDPGIFNLLLKEIGKEIYYRALNNKKITKLKVSVYLLGLQDKYGNHIPVEDALNCIIDIDNLDEVRKYKTVDDYFYDNKIDISFPMLAGKYGYLWKNAEAF